MLKYRSGHKEPPQMIRYYGEESRWIISAGRGRDMRLFSTMRDSQSFELSQGIVSDADFQGLLKSALRSTEYSKKTSNFHLLFILMHVRLTGFNLRYNKRERMG